jgi:O-antigen ligase
MKLPLLEFVFALFLVSGQIKAYLTYFKVPMPVDFTLLMSSILLGVFFVSCVLHGPNPRISKSQLRSCLLLGLLLSWNAFSLFYTISPAYSYEKMTLFVLIGICFTLPIVVRDIDAVMVVRSYCLLAFPMAIIFCHQMYTKYLSSWDERFMTFQANYLALSELLGFGLVCIFERWWILPSKAWQLPILISGLAIMLLLGARGPLLFVVACFVVRGVKELVSGKVKIKPKAVFQTIALFFMSVLLLVGFYFSNPVAVERLFERTLYRFSSIGSEFGQEERVGTQTMTRVDLIDQALEYSFESVSSTLFGQGVGGFGMRYFGEDKRAYPHNIFLEVLVETGIIGLGLLVCFLASVFFSLDLRSSISPLAVIYWLLNSLKSHTIVDLKVLFAALALATIPPLIHDSIDHIANRYKTGRK